MQKDRCLRDVFAKVQTEKLKSISNSLLACSFKTLRKDNDQNEQQNHSNANFDGASSLTTAHPLVDTILWEAETGSCLKKLHYLSLKSV